MFMESWILQVSYKVNVKPRASPGLHVNFARDPKYLWFHEQTKIEFIAYIYILL